MEMNMLKLMLLSVGLLNMVIIPAAKAKKLNRELSDGYFDCQQENHIIQLPQERVCDGVGDCGYNDDDDRFGWDEEIGVGDSYCSCEDHEYQCDYYVCVDKNVLCDGYDDCPSGQDERSPGGVECELTTTPIIETTTTTPPPPPATTTTPRLTQTTEPTTQTSIGEVECTADGVTVMVPADGFPAGNTMLLGGDIDCVGTEVMDNDILYYRYTTADLESCGLNIVNTTDDYIVYHTFLVNDAIPVMDIYCYMEKNGVVNINVTANPCIITASLDGFGTFDFFGSLYENDFSTLHDPAVPVDMCDGSNIYFGIKIDYNGDDLELFVEYCYVTEDPDDDASPQYYLINNGCLNADYDVVPSADMSPLKKNYMFSADEFVYTNGMTILYIRCGAVICDLGDANSICTQGCFSGRMKRGEHTSESTIITQGPYPIQGCPY